MWKDGREYAGDWKLTYGATELPDGAGAMTWADGRIYLGQFRDGKMSGHGKLTHPDGKVEEGQWRDDKFTGAAQ